MKQDNGHHRTHGRVGSGLRLPTTVDRLTHTARLEAMKHTPTSSLAARLALKVGPVCAALLAAAGVSSAGLSAAPQPKQLRRLRSVKPLYGCGPILA